MLDKLFENLARIQASSRPGDTWHAALRLTSDARVADWPQLLDQMALFL